MKENEMGVFALLSKIVEQDRSIELVLPENLKALEVLSEAGLSDLSCEVDGTYSEFSLSISSPHPYDVEVVDRAVEAIEGSSEPVLMQLIDLVLEQTGVKLGAVEFHFIYGMYTKNFMLQLNCMSQELVQYHDLQS